MCARVCMFFISNGLSIFALLPKMEFKHIISISIISLKICTILFCLAGVRHKSYRAGRLSFSCVIDKIKPHTQKLPKPCMKILEVPLSELIIADNFCYRLIYCIDYITNNNIIDSMAVQFANSPTFYQ